MVWVLLCGSIMGFVVANAVATDPTWLLASQWLAGQVTQLQAVRMISVSLLVLLLTVFWWQARRIRLVAVTLTNLGLTLSRYLAIALLSLCASLSDGLLDYYHYQTQLLKQAATITAIITPTQVSDHLTDTVNLARPSRTSQTLPIGGSQSRHVWQIIQRPSDTTDITTSQDLYQPAIRLPLNVLVSADTREHPKWQTTLNALQPGQQLQVKLALLPIAQPQYQSLPANASAVNLGFDTALWLRQRDIQATAQLVDIDENSLAPYTPTGVTKQWREQIEQVRGQLRANLMQHLKQTLADNAMAKGTAQSTIDSHAIVLGLLTGDKALMGSDIKHLYQVTGISHLLAISGPHVTLLASMVALLVVAVINVAVPTVLYYLPGRLIMLWVSVVMAGVYALLVGFELPAQRTFWLLVSATLATQWLVHVSSYRLLAWIGVLLLWLDSTAAVQAGFWLSFIAVGLLLKFSEHSRLNNGSLEKVSTVTPITYLWQSLKALLWLQLWLFILMMPVVIWFFGQVSIVGIGINLVAVPLLGLVIVPIDMLAGLLSLIPSVGHWLSAPLWSLLVGILKVFHASLAAIVASGFAKPLFMSILPNQLLLLAMAVVLLFGRGILPKLATIPLALACIAITLSVRQQSTQSPQLTVLSHPQFGIGLLVKGETAWLLLADNRRPLLAKQSTKQAVASAKASVATVAQATAQPEVELVPGLLNNQIFPLLASQHVHRLTGIISQTPSVTSHLLVQQLAATIPVNHYWQAGFDPLAPGQQLTYPYVSAKPCQFGQRWSQQGLQIEAMTGWALTLPPDQMNETDKLAAQTCFIQLTQTGPQPYRVAIGAGRNALPMQLATQLCQPSAINLLIMPYSLPLDLTWLLQTQPTHVHSLTGSWDNQRMTEPNQFALRQLARQFNQTNQPLTIIEAHQVGALRYTLAPKLAPKLAAR